MRGIQPTLAYHGCDRALAEKIISGKQHVKISQNEYDWLGGGAYFFENDPLRALEWAERIAKRPQHPLHRIEKPAVVGAILNLGNCLDLTDLESLRLIKEAYNVFRLVQEYTDPREDLPKNEEGFTGDVDLVKRRLDCAVINCLHQMKDRLENKDSVFDSVRGPFVEGGGLYPGAKIMSRTHVHICIRRPEVSVLGYFHPLHLPNGS